MENITILKTEAKQENPNHQISIDNRNKITISGISQVLSSNDTTIIMLIKTTKLVLCGKDLRIEKLDVDNGILEASGTIDSLKYNGDGLLKKIFKWELH